MSEMTESILSSVRNVVTGSDEKFFDHDLVVFINTSMFYLAKLGVEGAKGYVITDDTSKWSEISDDEALRENCKSYIILKVRELFDPSANSTIKETRTQLITELEWLIRERIESDIL